MHITQFPALVHTICLCVTVLRPGRPLVRIQSGVPARRKQHIACDELFHFIAKLIARSFCCSSLPNRNRFAGLQFGCRRCAAVLSVFVCHRKNIDFNRPLANHWYSGRLREPPIDRLVYCTGWSIFLFSFLVLIEINFTYKEAPLRMKEHICELWGCLKKRQIRAAIFLREI